MDSSDQSCLHDVVTSNKFWSNMYEHGAIQKLRFIILVPNQFGAV